MRNLLHWAAGKRKALTIKQRLLFLLNIVLLLAAGASAAGLQAVSGTLESLTAAERFRGGGETRFAQLACYLPVGQGKSVEEVESFRETLDAKMIEQSLEAPEGGRLYLDAYCGSASVTASADAGNVTAEAVGVGGDFFYFHPLHLRSGAYIRGGDLMDDLVVLDEETAWRLFGGTDLVGMSLTIDGKPFLVSGVVSREDDFATKKAYANNGGIFMSFSALSQLSEDASITCYEIVMPDPISNYAKNLVSESFPVGNGDVVENSSRYRLSHLLEVIRSFGERSMRKNGVIYPYWENAVRLTEDYAALLLALAVFFSICPLFFAVVLTIRQIRRGYRFVKRKAPEKIEAAVEARREKRLEREYENKAKGD